jgi:hypothetical protein
LIKFLRGGERFGRSDKERKIIKEERREGYWGICVMIILMRDIGA